MTIQEHFKKFYDMEPYIFIDEKEWQSIMETYDVMAFSRMSKSMETYEKEDVIEELSKVLHTYRPPIPVISEQQALNSLNKLKKSWWPDILVNKKWFPRNESKSNYPLSDWYFRRDNSGNNASNGFHIETRWKVDWTRTPSGWRTWQTVKGIKTIVRAF